MGECLASLQVRVENKKQANDKEPVHGLVTF
jgi:hypothetical protein